jgi:hypothetical protein
VGEEKPRRDEPGFFSFAGGRSLEQFFEFFHGKAGVTSNTAHGEGIDWMTSRNYQSSVALPHDDVFTLPLDYEAGTFQSADGVQMINAGNLRHN